MAAWNHERAWGSQPAQLARCMRQQLDAVGRRRSDRAEVGLNLLPRIGVAIDGAGLLSGTEVGEVLGRDNWLVQVLVSLNLVTCRRMRLAPVSGRLIGAPHGGRWATFVHCQPSRRARSIH